MDIKRVNEILGRAANQLLIEDAEMDERLADLEDSELEGGDDSDDGQEDE